MIIEKWRDFELENKDQEAIAAVLKKMPKSIIRRRPIKAPDGVIHLFLPFAVLYSNAHSFPDGCWIRGVLRLHIPRRASNKPQSQILGDGTQVEKAKDPRIGNLICDPPLHCWCLATLVCI